MIQRESPDAPPRLVPDEPLPPYSYVPGRFPHPTREQAGHSFGRPPDEPPPIEPASWTQSRTYLMGCDLFNHGYYWEAHEAWEAVWKACGRRGSVADFLKALIKLAAAGVKVREGRPGGLQRHAARAAQLFRAVRAKTSSAAYLGLDVDRLIEISDQLKRGIELPEPSQRAVQIVFDFRLLPRSSPSTPETR